MKKLAKTLLILLLVRPWVWFFLGLNRYSRLKLPSEGAFILAPNHNSHLDTFVLLALLPLDVALRTRIVAAGDYFFHLPILSWIFFDLFEMVPVWRREAKGKSDPIALMAEVLAQGNILLLFPEGTRGKPEQRSCVKRGIAKLSGQFPDLPIIPIYMRGLGKSLPRGESLFVPLTPQIRMGVMFTARGKSEEAIIAELEAGYNTLESQIPKNDWVAT